MTDKLDLTQGEGRELLSQNRTAVANDDVQLARDSAIALTEGQGDLSFEEDVRTNIDFDAEIKSTTPLMSDATINNEAGLSSALAGESDMIESFSRFRDEIKLDTNVSSIQALEDLLNTEEDESRKRVVENFLADPSNSTEEKSTFLQGYSIQRSRQDSLGTQYASGLSTIDSEGETIEASENRLTSAELILQASEARRQEQRIYNSYIIDNDISLTGALIDFVEAIIPFSSQIVSAKILTDFEKVMKEGALGPTTGKIEAAFKKDNQLSAIFALVSQKDKLRSMIDRMPVKDRAKMANALGEIVTRHSGVTSLNRNDFQKHYILRELTEGGYYGDTERVLDTIVSILDLVGLGMAFKGASRTASNFKFTFDDVNFKSAFDQPFPGGPSGGTSGAVLHPTADGVITLQARTAPVTTPKEGLVGKPQPASPFGVAKDFNPEEARNLYAASLEDETGRVSEVVSGINKSEFAHSTRMSKPFKKEDTVDNMPSDLDGQARIVDEETTRLIDFSYKPSGIGYPKFEKDAAAARVYNDLAEVTGLSPRLEMSKIQNDRGLINTSFMYGATPDTGFSTIGEALDTAELNLRPFGVTKDDLTIYSLDPISQKYVPFKVSDNRLIPFDGKGSIPETLYNTQGNFLVELSYKRAFNPADTDIFGTQAIVWRGIDRLTGNMFSLDRYLADASTRFQRYIAKGALRSVDKAFAIQGKLLEILKKNLGSLPAGSQAKILDLAKISNKERYKFSESEAILKGLSRKEAAGLRSWYKFWDTIWELDNRDLLRTLKGDGFQNFTNEAAGLKLFVKPVSKNIAKTLKNVYDPVSDTIVNLTDLAQLDALYKAGGTIVKSKRPVMYNSSVDINNSLVQNSVEYVIARQDSGNVLRGIIDSDTALDYIPGYYKVDYGKNKYFLDRITKDADGNDIVTTIAASDSSGHANFAKKRLDKNTPEGVTHSVRRARETKTITDFDDAQWDLNAATGRSSQLFRNERLSSIDGGDLVSGDNLLRDPVETAHQVANSISKRVAMRDWIESMKQRWVNDYGEFTQNNIFPDSGFSIKGSGRLENDRRLSDAKGLHEYIRFMEQVETSTIDDAFKLLNMGIAEIIEGASKSKVRGMIAEPFKKASDFAPLQSLRKAAFLSYIAANPARQFMVQSAQWSQLLALDPAFVAKDLHRQTGAILASKVNGTSEGLAKYFGLKSSKELDAVIKQWEDSGLHQSVDSNILIEGAQRQVLVDRATTQAGRAIQSTLRVPGAALNISKQAGFDAGEYFNLLTGWLYSRNQAIKSGADLTNPEVWEQVAVNAREITYGMNKAGQYTHSQGALGVITQFMTIPQKAVFSMLPNGSKAYTPVQRRQLAAFNLIAYGPPLQVLTGIAATIFASTGLEVLDPEVLKKIEHGMADFIVNETIKEITGVESTLDIEGSFAPGSVAPFYDLVQNFLEDPISSFAAGSLIFAENSRVSRILDDTQFAWANPKLNTYDKFTESLIISSELASGFSNLWKGMAMLQTDKRYSSSGRELPGQSTTPAAIAQMLGIPDRVITEDFEAFKTIKEAKDTVKADVKMFYDSAKRHVLRRGDTKDAQTFLETQRVFWNVYDLDPNTAVFAREEFARLAEQDAKTNVESSLHTAIIKTSGVMSSRESINLINSTGLSEDEKEKARSLFLKLDKSKESNE